MVKVTYSFITVRGVWGHAPPGNFFEFGVVRWLLRLFWDPKHHYFCPGMVPGF